jgi:hypothetical protein
MSDLEASFQGLSASELAAAEEEERPWLLQGLLAPGGVTLLTGMWKAGKTTLLSVLLAG